jgi:ketosteroid isomerase-like protein
VPEVKPPATDRQALVAELSDFFDAVERHDREFVLASVDRLCHPEVEFLSAVSGRIEGKRAGREALKAFLTEILDVWGELSYAHRRFELLGADAIIVHYRMKAQGRASGVELDQGAGAIWRIEDGLCRSAATFVDDEELDRAANVIGIEGAFRLMAEGGPEALLAHYDELFHEEFEWRPALVGGLDGRTYHGRAGFEQYWRDFTGAFDEIDFGNPGVEALGTNRVLAWGDLHVRGAGGGVPIEQEAAYLFEVRDRKVIAGRTFFSRAEAEEFAGA